MFFMQTQYFFHLFHLNTQERYKAMNQKGLKEIIKLIKGIRRILQKEKVENYVHEKSSLEIEDFINNFINVTNTNK